MPIITLSAEKALRKEFIERAIITKMNPQLIFKDLFPVVDLGGSSTFMFYRDDESAEDDIQKGVMSEPLEMSELGAMSKIEVSSISKEIGDTYQFGYSIEFSDKMKRENGFIDEVMRAYDRAAYGMARKINLDIFKAIDTFAAADAITLNDGTWDASSKINEDIIDMKKSFEGQIGWDYSLTDLFVPTDNYYEVQKFYSALDTFNPSNTEGTNLTNVKTVIPEGTVYGIDKNIKPLTIYKNVDPDHSTVNGGLINVNVWEDPNYPFKHHIELWAEMGIASKHPTAMLKQTGV
nr:MAG TPA: Encapsulin protein fold, Shell protein, VIRUS.6A [Caudoviricetes sp.]